MDKKTEEEFEKMRYREDTFKAWVTVDIIKSFISTQISKAHQAGRREVLKEVKDIILPLGIKSKIPSDVFRHLSEKLQPLEQKEKG